VTEAEVFPSCHDFVGAHGHAPPQRSVAAEQAGVSREPSPINKARIQRIVPLRLTGKHTLPAAQPVHLVLRKFEIEDAKVLQLMLALGSLGDGNDIRLLDQPS